jgi:hypothetical protein
MKQFLQHLSKSKDSSIKSVRMHGHADVGSQSLDPVNHDEKEKLTLRRSYNKESGVYDYDIALEGDGLERDAKALSLRTVRDSKGKVIGVYIGELLAKKLSEDSEIILLGCNAGGHAPSSCEDEICKKNRGQNKTLAQELSRKIPQAIVEGSTHETDWIYKEIIRFGPDWLNQSIAKHTQKYKIMASHVNRFKGGRLISHDNEVRTYNEK